MDWTVFSSAHFRKLWVATTLSLFGDFFSYITAVGLVPSLVPGALLMAFSGISTGVVNTYAISWLQRRTDSAMQGRVMSLVMLASMGLTPVAYAASGAIAEVNPTLLFHIGGGMILLCAAGAAASRSVRSLR